MITRLWAPALAALAALALAACSNPLPPGLQPDSVLPDHPARASSTPADGLLMVASLDHTLLRSGGGARFDLELKNTGSAPAQISADQICGPALLIHLQDANGQLVWGEPMRMCAVMGTPPPTTLAPGQSVSATRCFRLDPSPGCSMLNNLPPGTYSVAGSFHTFALPPLQLRVGAHPGPINPPPGAGGGVPGGSGGSVPGSAPGGVPSSPIQVQPSHGSP
jgi:hypothetical protein